MYVYIYIYTLLSLLRGTVGHRNPRAVDLEGLREAVEHLLAGGTYIYIHIYIYIYTHTRTI